MLESSPLHFFSSFLSAHQKKKGRAASEKRAEEPMQRPPPPAAPSSSVRSLLLPVFDDGGGVEPDQHDDSHHHHDDELEYLSAATLARRKEALEAGDARAQHAAPHRALYLRRNGDAVRLFEAASRRLAREPGCVRALMIRASVLVKKGKARAGGGKLGECG